MQKLQQRIGRAPVRAAGWRRPSVRPVSPHARRHDRPGGLLAALAALTVLVAIVTPPAPAEAAVPGEGGAGFVIARIKYDGGGDWYGNPSSLPNLARALRERTTIPVEREDEVRIGILDPDFFNYPFAYMNGHGTVRLSEGEVRRLRDYLLAGGFLFADDNYGMDESFRREIARVFPDRPLVEIPFSHPIYHAFYDLPSGPPKVHEHDGKPSQGFGIFEGNRLVVFYTYQSDIGDGLEDPDVHKDPPEVREQAMRMAVNAVVYALSR